VNEYEASVVWPSPTRTPNVYLPSFSWAYENGDAHGFQVCSLACASVDVVSLHWKPWDGS